MTTYLYPQNLRATANLWLWSLKDFVILCIAALFSILALIQLGALFPLAGTLCFGILSVRMEDTTILDFIRWACRFFLTTQQSFIWQ